MIKKSETKTSGRPSPSAEDDLVRLPIQLTLAQAARLKALADAHGTDVSDLVRAAVDSFLGPGKPGFLAGAHGRAPKGTKSAADGGKPGLTYEELEDLLKNR